MEMPIIRLVFMLTKNDCLDFDRESVSCRLCITPTQTNAPAISPGRLNCDGNIHDMEKDLPGFTIIPAESPPYKMLRHAYWSVELPKMKCWGLDAPLRQMEKIFAGKESEAFCICKEYNLSADLIVRVFAESNNMPELTIPHSSVSFWASTGATIQFDFYLD